MNCLVSELADVAAQERVKLDECEALSASTEAMQVRTMIIIVKEEKEKKRKEKGKKRKKKRNSFVNFLLMMSCIVCV